MQALLWWVGCLSCLGAMSIMIGNVVGWIPNPSEPIMIILLIAAAAGSVWGRLPPKNRNHQDG